MKICHFAAKIKQGAIFVINFAIQFFTINETIHIHGCQIFT